MFLNVLKQTNKMIKTDLLFCIITKIKQKTFLKLQECSSKTRKLPSFIWKKHIFDVSDIIKHKQERNINIKKVFCTEHKLLFSITCLSNIIYLELLGLTIKDFSFSIVICSLGSKLSVLILNRCISLSDMSIRNISKNCCSLSVLSVSYCTFSVNSLEIIFSSQLSKTLISLDVSGCVLISFYTNCFYFGENQILKTLLISEFQVPESSHLEQLLQLFPSLTKLQIKGKCLLYGKDIKRFENLFNVNIESETVLYDDSEISIEHYVMSLFR